MSNEAMRRFLYRIVTPTGIRREYRFDKALQIYEREGTRLYAYEKTLFPTRILLYWKTA